MRTCKRTACPVLVPSFFFVLLCFHFAANFIDIAHAAFAGEAIFGHRSGLRIPDSDQRRPCTPCSGFSSVDLIDFPILKVGVPKKNGFNEFVDVYKDHSGKTCVTGFSINMFCAALQSLHFKVNEPEFISFEKEDGESKGTYDDLLKNVSIKFDAVVGDVTIMSYRAEWIDFTQSYADSSVYVLLPIKHDTRKDMWIFLQPLNWNLWLAIIMAFIFVGIVIGTIEIRSNVNNTDFSGPLPLQLGMMIWYPISMLVLPERRMVVSMWSKLVMVVWLFVALVIMQSYTANLTTKLTIDQLRPFFDRQGNYSVGYQTDSFVKDFLIQYMNFTESQLIPLSTVDDYHNALSNKRVAAIYDELPYIKVFLQQHDSEYTVDGPFLRTNGLGFAFPLNSSLVPSISRAILNVTDNRTMDEIQERYFGKKKTSEVDLSRLPQDTPSLDAYNFIGLFIVMGSISITCLLCSEISRGINQRVSSTEKISPPENVTEIDNQDKMSPIPSTESAESIRMEEKGNPEDEDDDDKEEVHSS